MMLLPSAIKHYSESKSRMTEITSFDKDVDHQQSQTLLSGDGIGTNIWKLCGSIHFSYLDIILRPNIYTSTNILNRNLPGIPQ